MNSTIPATFLVDVVHPMDRYGAGYGRVTESLPSWFSTLIFQEAGGATHCVCERMSPTMSTVRIFNSAVFLSNEKKSAAKRSRTPLQRRKGSAKSSESQGTGYPSVAQLLLGYPKPPRDAPCMAIKHGFGRRQRRWTIADESHHHRVAHVNAITRSRDGSSRLCLTEDKDMFNRTVR